MLSIKGLSYEYGKKEVFREIDFSIIQGEKVCLIGENGCGKSTLLKLISKNLERQSGEFLHEKGLISLYMHQEIYTFFDRKVMDFLKSVTGFQEAEKEYYASLENIEKDIEGYSHTLEKIEKLELFTFERRVDEAIRKLNLPKNIIERRVGTLSGGEKTKLSLVAILVARCDLYLLDEPTNNMDSQGVKILEEYIGSSKKSFIIVSHDKQFISKMGNRLVEISAPTQLNSYHLTLSEYLYAKKSQRDAAENKYKEFLEEKKRLKESMKEKKRAIQETERCKAEDNNKLAFNSHKEKVLRTYGNRINAISSQLERLEEVKRPEKLNDLSFNFQIESNKVNARLVVLKEATVEYDNLVLGPYNFEVGTKDRIIITGENGSGKTTLLKLIAKLIEPSSGECIVNKNIKMGYINQEYLLNSMNHSIIDNMIVMTEKSRSECYNILARFNIRKEKADGFPSSLSPGERARVHLSAMISKKVSLLMLDEPTNHLDMQMSYELQEALKEYQGALIVITHDRALISTMKEARVIILNNGKVV